MQIYSKEHNGTQSETKTLEDCAKADTETKDVVLKAKISNDNLKLASIANEELKEMPQQSIITEDEFQKLETVADNSCEITANDDAALVSPAIVENGSLACSNNCVCFCNEDGAHHVLSIVENGFLINHENNCDNENGNENENDDDDRS